MSGPRPLSELLRRGQSPLGRLADQAKAHCALTDHLRAGLPAELAGALIAAHLHEDGLLVVTASSPAWASRLRFESARLLEQCRQLLPGAARLRIRVQQGSQAG